MNFKNPGAELFIPDNKPESEAVSRTTHMAVSAHQDDIEIMACDGILKCFRKEEQWFFAVIVTNGAGSSRNGSYASCPDEEMKEIRKLEQKKAAFVGEYGGVALLDYTSPEAKDPANMDIVEELKRIIKAARPKVVYTHNLADKHDTHIGVVTKLIKALRELPSEARPEKLYGCEVWRGLDWVNDEEKVVFDVSAHPNISNAVMEVYDSQICGRKRYDLGTAGRRTSNALFSSSHGIDNAASMIYGMDLTPLIENESLGICEYIRGYIERFSKDVTDRISKVL